MLICQPDISPTKILVRQTCWANLTVRVTDKLSLSLSILMAFSRWTWVSRCSLKQRMMEVMVTTGAISRAKLQSNHHHQQTNTQFFLHNGCPSCHPTNSVKALKEKYHIPWTCLPQAQLGVFQLCLWPLIAPGYLGGGLPGYWLM